jgi:hypothetical protein
LGVGIVFSKAGASLLAPPLAAQHADKKKAPPERGRSVDLVGLGG